MIDGLWKQRIWEMIGIVTCSNTDIYENGISTIMKTFIKAKSITSKCSNGFNLRYNRKINRIKRQNWF